jgi:hypothetical protein
VSNPAVTATNGVTAGLLYSRSSALRPTLVVFGIALLYLLLRVPNPEFFLDSDDQGYQMALGMAVANGSIPGFDFVSQYGPFVAFASWLGWFISGNVIGEIVLCAAGYAAAIALVYAYTSRHGNVMAAVLATVILLVLFSRFYKWYYWLLPILTLLTAERFAAARSAGAPRWALLVGWGLLVGVGGLFRYDLLLEGLVFGAIVIVAVELTPMARIRANLAPAIREIAVFGVSCLALPAFYCALIWAFRGWHQLSLVLYSVIDGSLDTVVHYGVRPFRFANDGFSFGNAVAFLQVAFPIVCGIALYLSVSRMRFGKPAERNESFPLFCAALMGLGLFPQALHRADDQHLLQVLPPFVITLGLLFSALIDAEAKIGKKSMATIGFGFVALAMATIAPGAGNDLRSPLRDQLALWPYLAGLPDSAPEYAVADMASAIRRLTPPGATVFLVMPQTRMSMLFFAERRQPGLFPTYEPGMFSGDRWLKENAALLRRSPPDYLVLPRGSIGRRPGIPAPYVQDVLANWQMTYRTIAYQNPYFILLSRNG